MSDGTSDGRTSVGRPSIYGKFHTALYGSVREFTDVRKFTDASVEILWKFPYIDGLITDMLSVNARNKVPAAILAGTSDNLRKFLTVITLTLTLTLNPNP